MIISSSVRSVVKIAFLASAVLSVVRAFSIKSVFGVLLNSGSVFKIIQQNFFLCGFNFEIRSPRAVGGGVSSIIHWGGVWHGKQVKVRGGFDISKHVFYSTIVSSCRFDKVLHFLLRWAFSLVGTTKSAYELICMLD